MGRTREKRGSIRSLWGAMVSLIALGGAGVTACAQAGEENTGEENIGVARQAITSETARIQQILENGTVGETGFLLKPVGGPIAEGYNENVVQDPASSVKTLIAVALLQAIEDGGEFDLDTTVSYPTDMNGSCPLWTGPQTTNTLREVMRRMLVNSDNLETRVLVQHLGGLEAINDKADELGMTSTNMDGHIGCAASRITQVDLALLYEGIADGSLISAAHRDELFANMPADGGSSGTLFSARAIVDEEAASLGVTSAEADLFKSQLKLHYKMGLGCCPSIITISGLAEIPTCDGETTGSAGWVWGLYLGGASYEESGPNTSVFLANDAEPLRTPIRSALANFQQCSAGSIGGTGSPCAHNGECDSYVCSGGICQPAMCAPTCNQGAPCGSNADCSSGVCAEGLCAPPACAPNCETGAACANNGDCSSSVCTNNSCAPSWCAPTCVNGAPCGSNADCASGVCTSGRCGG